MFHRYGRKVTSVHAKPLNDLTRIVAAEHLLTDEKRCGLIEQIQGNCSLETPRFDSLCSTLIHNFVNHCQSLPETSNSYYSEQGGLIDHALNRTEAALELFKQYLIVDEKASLSEEQKLWQYALLSAAILQGIGKLQIDYMVNIYDNKGQFLRQWNPLLENFSPIGSYYNYSFQKETNIEFRRRLNILMARLIMPVSGYAWIVSNPQVLEIWLALLNEDPYSAGTLGAILVRADAIAIQRYFNQFASRSYGTKNSRYGRVGTFTGGTPESLSERDQQYGIEFLVWLTNALDSKKIMINKAPLLMVPGGLLMVADIFKLFIRENPEYKNWQAVQNGFLSLGLHHVGKEGAIISRVEQHNNQQIHEGIVFVDYAIALPAEVLLHNLHTGNAETVSATELMSLTQTNNDFTIQHQPAAITKSLLCLNAGGKWQAPSNDVALKPSINPRTI